MPIAIAKTVLDAASSISSRHTDGLRLLSWNGGCFYFRFHHTPGSFPFIHGPANF
jgi:hypothetical protein